MRSMSGRFALLLAVTVAPNACTPDAALTPMAPEGSALVVDAGRRDVPYTSAIPLKGKPGGRLAVAFNDGYIYTMQPDGSLLSRLVPGLDPSWSPDGTKLAFWRLNALGSSAGIFVMDAGGVRKIVENGYGPTWSPDGARIAFGCGGICVVNADGTHRTVVTFDSGSRVLGDTCVQDSDPAWSPNGSTIAFTRWKTGVRCFPPGTMLSFPFDFWTDIWFVESDGSALRPLKQDSDPSLPYAGWPAWSPDGSRLAFYAMTPDGDAITVANADGSGRRTVAFRTEIDWMGFLGGPDWSPDGKRIVFGSGGN